jgi:hypothetical protein
MAIVLINDSYGITNEKSGIFVNSISDYVDVYSKIIDSIHNNSQLKIIVRDSTCFKWLSKLKAQYGDTNIEIWENNPREALMRKWHLNHLPENVSDRDILETNLLELKINPKEDEIFENIILENFYSSVLTHKEFSIYKLVNLLQDVAVNQKWETYKNRPIILKQYKDRLEEWIESSKKEEYNTIIESLKDNPIIVYQKLMNFKLLKSYPNKIGESVLGNDFYIYKKLNLDLSNLRIDLDKVERAINEIDIFFQNDIKVNSLDKIEEVLSILSGILPLEFNFLKKTVNNFKKNVTKELIEKIKNKFSAISNLEQISIEFKELDLLIARKIPSEPSNDWDAEKWINWAIEEYLPYQFWLEDLNEFDERIALYSEKFGDWFYDNFIKLKTSFPRFLHKVIPNISYEIQNKAEISLFLVIDNFNYKYFGDLCTFLKQNGFFCKDSQPHFSMIPTETSVCKRSLFSGEPEINILGNKSYEQIIHDAWSGYMGSKKFKFLSNLGALNKIRSVEHEVYILNYCNIDELFHKDEEELGRPHREEVGYYLQNLVNSVVNFSKRLRIEHKFSIYICSDHGSTKIQSTASNTIDRKYYKTKSEDKHHRFVTATDLQVQNLPSHVESNAYVLRKEEYGLLENVIIARGYSRFKKTNGRYYIHGGLSPEEVIVPFAVFNKLIVEPKEIIIHLLQDTFRYSVKSNIELEILNINDHEIVDITVDILNSNVESKIGRVNEINAKSKAVLEIPSRFKKIPYEKEKKYLIIKIIYQMLGKIYNQQNEIPIVVKSIVEQKSNLEDIF